MRPPVSCRALAVSLAVTHLLIAAPGTAMGRSPRHPAPPGQPLAGYGSPAGYICDRLRNGREINHRNCIDFGNTGKGTRCWVYLPEKLRDGERAPVVVYLHGFSAIVPPIYAGLISHLVRQGYIVIFPSYNRGGFLGMFLDMDQYAMLDRAIAAVNRALALPAVARAADRDSIVLASHSCGGMMSLGWIARGGVPVRGMVMTHPNISNDAIPALVRVLFMRGFRELAYREMAASITCPVIVIGGADDTIARPAHVRGVYDALVNASSRAYYQFESDRHGVPRLESDHVAACQDDGWIPGWLIDLMGSAVGGVSGFEEDAIDFRVHYAAIDAALEGDYLPLFEMGAWSDGTPVKPVTLLMSATGFSPPAGR